MKGQRAAGNEDTAPAKTKGDQKPLSVEVDYERYAHFLEDTQLSDEEKITYLQTLWKIICEFVALGFEVHPLQQAQKSCGEPDEKPTQAPQDGETDVEYLGPFLRDNFTRLAALSRNGKAEESIHEHDN